MLRRWMIKRELKKWRQELQSLELALEYCNEVPDGKEQPYLDAVHECWQVIDGLKILLKQT